MYNYAYGTCPNSHIISEKLISLPLHLSMSNDDVEYVIEHVIKINNIITS
jgi:dTDP-4-amino-4,6-dideoxygalactose transaminase